MHYMGVSRIQHPRGADPGYDICKKSAGCRGGCFRPPGGVQGQSPGGGPGGEAPGKCAILGNFGPTLIHSGASKL